MLWDAETYSVESRATGSSNDEECDGISFSLCIFEKSKMKEVVKFSTQKGFYR